MGIEQSIEEIAAYYPEDVAVPLILARLDNEYTALENAMKDIRERYLKLDVDDPAMQNDIADLRLKAVDAYKPAYRIESFLTEKMGVDISKFMPEYEGDHNISAVKEKGWELSFVTLKENAMRTLGGHCNIIGDMVLLERKLYHHTYLAAVMKPTICDTAEKGETCIEYDSETIVFEEDIVDQL
ncbi:hypothetical protein CUJ83_05130 [Methanocella sp. CWC-04]|uniref:Uncharacterized protein n=1 Tax=Methanooceanicella nereidis TaxID=2052831 RepID=A0AAP2RCJ8_9EURY|nr:hypothetical protein [Methanocella sp. CWC-04]MCD1294381.1 hypothetical protein [Methanocella sp. CWC-04]